jgi:hypothetical protein
VEVDKDSKKQDMFKKGLNLELRTLLTPQIYPDFNTLMNMAIHTERARAEEKKENKHKFMALREKLALVTGNAPVTDQLLQISQER